VRAFFDSVIDGVQGHQIKCGVKTFVMFVINIIKYGDVSCGRKRRHKVNEIKECCFLIAVTSLSVRFVCGRLVGRGFWVRILLCMLRVVRYWSLRRSDSSSRGVLQSGYECVCVCVSH
jgi:hypothetical protein